MILEKNIWVGITKEIFPFSQFFSKYVYVRHAEDFMASNEYVNSILMNCAKVRYLDYFLGMMCTSVFFNIFSLRKKLGSNKKK